MRQPGRDASTAPRGQCGRPQVQIRLSTDCIKMEALSNVACK